MWAVYEYVDGRECDRSQAQSDQHQHRHTRAPNEGAGSGPYFKLAFAAVVAITVLALVLNVLLALLGSDTDQVKAAAETCSTTYKMGFGAIVGLIGGKAT
jgi:hypothetical protein